MLTYRLYFRDSGSIVARHEFAAVDDSEAIALADILSDACGDLCDLFELWQGTRCVVAERAPSPLSDATMTEKLQEALIKCEENIRSSHWSIARSKKLLASLDQIRAQARASNARRGRG